MHLNVLRAGGAVSLWMLALSTPVWAQAPVSASSSRPPQVFSSDSPYLGSESVSAMMGKPAPFGITWGATAQEIQAQGVKLETVKRAFNLTFDLTGSLPKATTDAEAFVLVFDDRLGLVKESLMTHPKVDDEVGSQVRERFAQYQEFLTAKGYNKLLDHRLINREKFQSYGDFFLCLRDETCAQWDTLYKKGGEYIVLSIEGDGPRKGHVEMSIETKAFYAARAAQKDASLQSDADAF